MKQKSSKPPVLACYLMKRIVRFDDRCAVLGDFYEEYEDIRQNRGYIQSVAWCYLQILYSFPSFVLNSTYLSSLMLKNYLVIAFRNLKKHKTYSVINLSGLSVGMACCILIMGYVGNEFSFDKFHKNSNRIYRMYKFEKRISGERSNAALPPPLGTIIKSEIPEAEYVVRLFKPFNEPNKHIKFENSWYKEEVYYADQEFFEVFSFPFAEGDHKTALHDPSSVVLSKDLAQIIFGSETAFGKTISIGIGGNNLDFTVTGVVEKFPDNSSIRFPMLLNFSRVQDELGNMFGDNVLDSWNSFTEIYILAQENSSIEDMEARLPALTEIYFGDQISMMRSYGQLVEGDDVFQLRMQPLTNMYLDPDIAGITLTSNPSYSYILSGIGFLLLLLACINFMMLSIGRSVNRSREVGVRKVLGASRNQLVKQFWGEAVLLSFFSLLLGMIFTVYFLPTFNSLSGKSLTIFHLVNFDTVYVLIGLMLFTGIIAGSYPAIFLSRFRPVDVLKSSLKISGKHIMNQTLIVFQFAMSIGFIISMFTMVKQLDYMKTKDLGFEKEQIVVLPTNTEGENGANLLELLKTSLSQYSSFGNVSGSDGSFANTSLSMSIHINGENLDVATYRVDANYLSMFDIDLVQGRNFSGKIVSDAGEAVIINEKLVRDLDWSIESAIGRNVPVGFPNKSVIGVVKDFHFDELHNEIGPLMMHMNPGRPIKNIYVKIAPDNIAGSLSVLEEEWSNSAAGKPFAYYFLDDDVNKYYENDRRWGSIVNFSSIIAIIISCLGLLGLSTITVLQRTKEIGIRKTLGASVPGILRLLILDLVKPVLLANFIAWPIAYLVMSGWLKEFAYRVDVGIWLFPIAGATALLIATATIGLTAMKGARSNPVDTLRYE